MTDNRLKRIAAVLAKRQTTLTVVFENVWDPHNISACLRTCDAVGIQNIHIISSDEKKLSKLGRKSSSSAAKWLSISHHSNVKTCFDELRKNKFKILSTKLSESSLSLHSIDFCKPVALVFGNEHDGVSGEAAQLSDGNFIIPQAGMIQSLNISVACAVSLYEAFRQRNAKGFYKEQQLSAQEYQVLFDEWMKK